MSTADLPRSTPAAEGVDARGVAAFLDAVEADPSIDPHSVVVLRHGRVVASGWWAPYAAERPHLLYSLSKSFTATAAGLAVAEGLVGLDDTVLSHFPELDAEVGDPRSRAMLVRHVAAMASGHVEDTWDRVLAADPQEPVRAFLLLPPDEEPGSVFAYNQSATYALGAIVQRASGQTLTEYLRPRLLDPLGIGAAAWQQHPAGRDLAFTGLHAATDAVARLGQLHLQGGVWNGVQLLPAAWVAEATRRHIATDGGNPDWEQGYGFQFWRSQHGYRGDGAYGQFCLVLPEQDAVVAITSATTEMQRVLDAVWAHLLPAMGPAPLPASDEDAALAQRLARLALPAVVAPEAAPADRAAWAGAAFSPAGGGGEDRAALTGVRVVEDGSGWAVALGDEASTVLCPLGTDGWRVSEPEAAPVGGAVPVAVSGGWDAQELRCDVLFLETPHRLSLTCSLATGTVDARWATVPLRAGHLHDLRSPARG